MTFIIKGTGDDACAELKSALDAQSAAFEAGLKAFFQPAMASPNASAAPARNDQKVTATAVPAARMLATSRRRFKF